MSNMEKLAEMIKNDGAFMEQLKDLGGEKEAAAKLVEEYAIKHGFDPEEIDDGQLEAVAGGRSDSTWFWDTLLTCILRGF